MAEKVSRRALFKGMAAGAGAVALGATVGIEEGEVHQVARYEYLLEIHIDDDTGETTLGRSWSREIEPLHWERKS